MNGHYLDSEGKRSRYSVGLSVRRNAPVKGDYEHAWTFATGVIWGAVLLMIAETLAGVL